MNDNEQSPLTADSQIISPEVVEQVMVDKALQDPAGLPADKAAAFFMKSAQELSRLIKDMSLRELKRMVMNIAAYPYIDIKVPKKGSIEERATYFFNEMTTHKMIMQLQFEQEKVLKEMEEEKNNNQSLIKGDTNEQSKD